MLVHRALNVHGGEAERAYEARTISLLAVRWPCTYGLQRSARERRVQNQELKVRARGRRQRLAEPTALVEGASNPASGERGAARTVSVDK